MRAAGIDWHRWHARLVAWAAWQSTEHRAPLGRPGKPELRVTLDESDCLHVDQLIARIGRSTLGMDALTAYYRRRWWDDSVPGYRLLGVHLGQVMRRKAWRRQWQERVAYEPGCSMRDKFEAAARRLLDEATAQLDREERGAGIAMVG